MLQCSRELSFSEASSCRYRLFHGDKKLSAHPQPLQPDITIIRDQTLTAFPVTDGLVVV
jgi:hypothetical protein